MIFDVIEKATGKVVYRYESDVAIEWGGMEYVTHEHIQVPVTEPFDVVHPITNTEPRIITKLEYLRRFTVEERTAIRAAAKVSPILEDYLELMSLAEEINLNDPDISSAIDMLVQAGMLTQDRAHEVLNGN